MSEDSEFEWGGISDVDVDNIDLKLFPKIADVKYSKLRLNKGDCIFMPSGNIYELISIFIVFYNISHNMTPFLMPVLHCTALDCIVLHYVLYFTALNCIAFCCVTLYCVLLYCILLYCMTIPHFIQLYCIALSCIALFCILSCCTVLCYISLLCNL